jgi:recombination protein RecT
MPKEATEVLPAVVENKMEPKQAKPIDNVRAALEKMKPQMQLALPRHLTPERLVRVAMSAIQNNPKLLDCDRVSLYAAIMCCAQLGLEPDGVLGQAYLVPFKGKVQFIPGYRGLINLARNSGEVESISAHEVCANDSFTYKFGLNERLDHVPASGDRGAVVYFYAIAKFRGGGHHFDVMSVAEVEAIRNKSAGWKAFESKQIRETPWQDNFVEMGKKTAIRRIAKFLPMNVQKAAAIADMYDSGRHAQLGSAGEIEISSGEEVIDVEAMASTSSDLDNFADPAAA